MAFPDSAWGPRPLLDLEFWPSFNQYPNCWVRLAPMAAVRSDTFKEEEIIFDYKRAQNLLINELDSAGLKNSQFMVFHQKKASYLAPKELKMPFIQKVFAAAVEAATAVMPLPTLQECRYTSMAFPASTGDVTHVHIVAPKEKEHVFVNPKY